VRKGSDPVEDARRKRIIGKEARAGIGTLTALPDLYAKHRGAHLKSWTESRRRIEHVFSTHLARPMTLLKPADLQAGR
jgi:hypothetical protein